MQLTQRDFLKTVGTVSVAAGLVADRDRKFGAQSVLGATAKIDANPYSDTRPVAAGRTADADAHRAPLPAAVEYVAHERYLRDLAGFAAIGFAIAESAKLFGYRGLVWREREAVDVASGRGFNENQALAQFGSSLGGNEAGGGGGFGGFGGGSFGGGGAGGSW